MVWGMVSAQGGGRGETCSLKFANVAQGKVRGMTDLDRLWDWIQRGTTRKGLSVERLEGALRGADEREVRQFAHDLELAVGLLSTPEVADALTSNVALMAGGTLTEDQRDYIVAGIVASGRESFDRVLTDPSVLTTGEWPECEELLYVADDVLDVEDGSDVWAGSIYAYGPVLEQGELNDNKYPVKREPLDPDFPVETFSWLVVNVVDARQFPMGIYVCGGREFVRYRPIDSDRLSDAFGWAEFDIQEELRPAIDFSLMPDLTLAINVLVGTASVSPSYKLMSPGGMPWCIKWGIEVEVDFEKISAMSKKELEHSARLIVLDSLGTYFEDHPRELKAVRSLGR